MKSFGLEKTWRSSGTGSQTFNNSTSYPIPYGKYFTNVTLVGGSNVVGVAATYNTQNPATYNAQNPATYNAQNPASYNANNIASYNANNVASYNAQNASSYNTNNVSTYNANNVAGYNPYNGFYVTHYSLTNTTNPDNGYPGPSYSSYETYTDGSCPSPSTTNLSYSYTVDNYTCSGFGNNANYNAQNPATYNAQNPASYNANNAATYNAQNPASYNAQNVASYNANNISTYNANNVVSYNANNVATYNAPQAGVATSITMGNYSLSAAGAPAGNNVVAGSTVGPTLLPYYTTTGTYDLTTATVVVGNPSGSANIISR